METWRPSSTLDGEVKKDKIEKIEILPDGIEATKVYTTGNIKSARLCTTGLCG